MQRRCLVAGLLVLCAAPAMAEAPKRIAVFNLELQNTSPAPTTPEETARLKSLDTELRQELAKHYTEVDVTPVQDKVAQVGSIRGCNGCERDFARDLHADLVAYGWVQKVSNLILNINLVIEDAATGQQLKADSVDIRGNTDESWHRGLHYLINERLFRDE